jgi:hypothetical protein
MVETAGVVGMKHEPAAGKSEARDFTNSGCQALRDEWLRWDCRRSLVPRRLADAARTVVNFTPERRRIHSSGNPALRRPSNEAGRFGVCSFSHLIVIAGLRRRASARAAFASLSLPACA